MDERAQRADRCVESFRRVNGYLRAADADDWTTLNLTMAQLRILFRLYYEGPLTVGRLAHSLGVTLPSVTGTVDRLVQQALVERCTDASDRRLVINQLTPAGQGLIERLQQGRRARLRALLERLTTAEIAAVDDALGLLAGAADACKIEERPVQALAATTLAATKGETGA